MTNKIIKVKNYIFPAIIMFFMLVFVFFSDRYIKSSILGLKLFALSVMPSTLPFFFLTTLLTKTGSLNKFCTLLNKPCNFLFRQNGICFYCFLMSVLSGYPIGSRIIYDLYQNGLINKCEASKMSVLCSTSGPLFVIGAVGVCMFENKYIGFIIYISHVLSALLNGFIFRNYGTFNKTSINLSSQNNVDNVLYESIYNSVISTLIVGGFVSIFYVFADILNDFNLLYPFQKGLYFVLFPFTQNFNYAKAFCIGLVECTKGLKLISTISSCFISVSLSAGLVSFGGISIILQSIIYLKKAEVKTLFFIFGKLLQMIFSIIISFLLCLIFL